jgi:hypothetical protein
MMTWPKRGVYDLSERTGGDLPQTTAVPSDALLAREGESGGQPRSSHLFTAYHRAGKPVLYELLPIRKG